MDEDSHEALVDDSAFDTDLLKLSTSELVVAMEGFDQNGVPAWVTRARSSSSGGWKKTYNTPAWAKSLIPSAAGVRLQRHHREDGSECWQGWYPNPFGQQSWSVSGEHALDAVIGRLWAMHKRCTEGSGLT